MKIAIYIVVIYLFVVWVSLIISGSKKMREIRQKAGFGDCETYYNVKQYAGYRPTKENLKVLDDLKSHRKKFFLIWFLSLLGSLIILSVVSVLSAIYFYK